MKFTPSPFENISSTLPFIPSQELSPFYSLNSVTGKKTNPLSNYMESQIIVAYPSTSSVSNICCENLSSSSSHSNLILHNFIPHYINNQTNNNNFKNKTIRSILEDSIYQSYLENNNKECSSNHNNLSHVCCHKRDSDEYTPSLLLHQLLHSVFSVRDSSLPSSSVSINLLQW
jgi:hypothetical protein